MGRYYEIHATLNKRPRERRPPVRSPTTRRSPSCHTRPRTGTSRKRSRSPAARGMRASVVAQYLNHRLGHPHRWHLGWLVAGSHRTNLYAATIDVLGETGHGLPYRQFLLMRSNSGLSGYEKWTDEALRGRRARVHRQVRAHQADDHQSRQRAAEQGRRRQAATSRRTSRSTRK